MPPPAPTPLVLPARALAAMAVELPRDALESLSESESLEEARAQGLVSHSELEGDEIAALDDEAIYEGPSGDDDDEVTLHGAALPVSWEAAASIHSNPWGNARGTHTSAKAPHPLRDADGEISSFRLRRDEHAPPGPAAESPFARTMNSNSPMAATAGPALGSARSAPPPPPSKKLNVLASRILFEPTPPPGEPSSMLPPPAGYSDARESSYRGHLPAESSNPFRTHTPSAPGVNAPGLGALGFGSTSVSVTGVSAPNSSGPNYGAGLFGGGASSGAALSSPSLGAPALSSPSFSGTLASAPGGPNPSPQGLPSNVDPFRLFRGSRDDEFEDETETQVLVRADAPETLGPLERSIGPNSVPPPRIPPPPTLPPRRGVNWLALGGGTLVGGAALAFAAFQVFSPKKGELIVDVANQQCNVMSDVRIYVDDELACATTPCRLETAARSHVVYAEAPGYPRTAAEAVIVEAGSVTLHKLQLGPVAETGVAVRSKLPGLSLYVDGVQVGDLPQRLPSLTPGDHTLLITGGERFYAEERKIHLEEGQFMVIDSVDLKLRNGDLLVHSTQSLADTQVELDGTPIELPYEKQLDASRRYRVTARRSGYEPFETWVAFTSDTPKQEVNVQLTAKGAREESSRSSGGSSRRAASSAVTAATGKATLNLNSNPVSMVILDGKPIGQTPRVGVAVTAGTHSVVFVSPTKGRKRASATVAAGASKNVSVRF